jgi:hypothetical protein
LALLGLGSADQVAGNGVPVIYGGRSGSATHDVPRLNGAAPAQEGAGGTPSTAR